MSLLTFISFSRCKIIVPIEQNKPILIYVIYYPSESGNCYKHLRLLTYTFESWHYIDISRGSSISKENSTIIHWTWMMHFYLNIHLLHALMVKPIVVHWSAKVSWKVQSLIRPSGPKYVNWSRLAQFIYNHR